MAPGAPTGRVVYLVSLIAPALVIPVLLVLSLALPSLPFRQDGVTTAAPEWLVQPAAFVAGLLRRVAADQQVTVRYRVLPRCAIPRVRINNPSTLYSAGRPRCRPGSDYALSITLDRASLPLYRPLESTVRLVARAYYRGGNGAAIRIDLGRLRGQSAGIEAVASALSVGQAPHYSDRPNATIRALSATSVAVLP